MTAPTSDERREVAARLRQMAGRHDVDKRDVIHVFDDADIRKLADLMDPTCHVKEYGHPDEFRVVKGCSVCHCGWYEDVFDRPYRYCPHCGARVVRDDGRE